jgi:hypothetical protein
MIAKQAIEMLVDLAEERDIDDAWHHADTRGLTARLVGENLSNAFSARVDGSELCLVIDDDEDDDPLVINLASLLADVCSMYSFVSKTKLMLDTLEDSP